MKRLVLLAVIVLSGCGRDSGTPTAHPLSPEQANHVGLGYSPDGKRMTWWEKEGDAWRMWIANADMTEPRKVALTSHATTANAGSVVWSPDGSRFVAAADMTSPLPSLYLVDSSLAVRRVTSSTVFEVPLSWNRDGKRVTFFTVVGGAVLTMAVNVDSGVPYTLIPDEHSPHLAFWSRDGAHTAIWVFDKGHETVWIGDSAGAHRRPVSGDGFEELPGPGVDPWAPDGSGVIYTSRRTGTTDIWFAPADGSAPRQLTNDVRDDDQPVWSPDGKWIAFRSNRGLQTDLWLMPAAGGAARRVTDDRLQETLVGWRPGSSELLYSSGRTSRTLWRYALADSSEHQLTPDSLDLAWFEPAPDGRAAVLFDHGGGVNDLAVVSARGDSIRTVLRDARGEGVQWSPDGTRLVFASDRGGSEDIWVIDAVGGAPRQLTRFPTREFGPVWNADGSSIYFMAYHEATFADIWRVSSSGGEPQRITNGAQVLNLCMQTHRKNELIVTTLSTSSAAFKLARVGTGGRLTTLWDRTAADCGVVSPAGDSLVSIVGEGGGLVTMLLPLTGRPGRQLLRPGQEARDWSADGRHVVYQFPAGTGTDLGILDVAAGSTRRITNSPANETGAEYSADGSAIFFRRSIPINRLTSVDIRRVLARRE